jgi:hypothetical protein
LEKKKSKKKLELEQNNDEKKDIVWNEKRLGDLPWDVDQFGPVDIHFNFNINQLYEIESVSERFKVQFDIVFRWRCFLFSLSLFRFFFDLLIFLVFFV